MKKTVAVIATLAIISGIGYRWLQVLPYPIGTGEEKKSPDGRHTAHITQYYDMSIWGVSRSWVEFEITDANGDRTNFWETYPIPEAIFGSRTDTDIVHWSDDSRYARFTFPTIEVRLNAE